MSEIAVDDLSRDDRQRLVTEWCRRTFGQESAGDRHKRVLRFLEEALELYQAEGGDINQAGDLLARVFSRPSGDPRQEVGGVCVTLLSYCSAAELSVDDCEAAEIKRVLNRPVAEARWRYAAKTDAGF